MNGLDLLSSIANISVDDLYIKQDMEVRLISELSIKDLLRLDMDDFKGLTYNKYWTLVFESPCMAEDVVKEPVVKRRKKSSESKTVSIALNTKDAEKIMEQVDEEVDDFDLFA